MADSHDTPSLPENRTDLETLIEAAITRLDQMEPDPDLEDGFDDEPELGVPEARTGSWNGLTAEAFVDDREADDSDDEPSLASSESHRTLWMGGVGAILNPDRYGSMGDELRRTWETSQRSWAEGSGDDREEECEDEGAQCEDEGAKDDDDGWDDDLEPEALEIGDSVVEPVPDLVTLGKNL